MKRRHYGLLTELQLKVLKLRLRGFSLKEIAKCSKPPDRILLLLRKELGLI